MKLSRLCGHNTLTPGFPAAKHSELWDTEVTELGREPSSGCHVQEADPGSAPGAGDQPGPTAQTPPIPIWGLPGTVQAQDTRGLPAQPRMEKGLRPPIVPVEEAA